MSFVDRLEQVRLVAGLNQTDLSRLCGFRRTYINSIERDARPEVGLSRLVAIGFALGCSLDWLALNQGEPPSAEDVHRAVDRARRDPKAVQRAVDAALGLPTRPPASVRTRMSQCPLETGSPRVARGRRRSSTALAKARPRRPLPEARS